LLPQIFPVTSDQALFAVSMKALLVAKALRFVQPAYPCTTVSVCIVFNLLRDLRKIPREKEKAPLFSGAGAGDRNPYSW
jgi:hypothetical protein